MAVFHRKEPRDLSAAVRFYLAREHQDAQEAAGHLVFVTPGGEAAQAQTESRTAQ